jgi:hypothetical protein
VVAENLDLNLLRVFDALMDGDRPSQWLRDHIVAAAAGG